MSVLKLSIHKMIYNLCVRIITIISVVLFMGIMTSCLAVSKIKRNSDIKSDKADYCVKSPGLLCVSDHDFYEDIRKKQFDTLLLLINDSNPDVSYYAAVALEEHCQLARSSDVIDAVKTIPREDRWPMYRTMRSYTTKEILCFLTDSLREEVELFRDDKPFDDRNVFYLLTSIEAIFKHKRESVVSK